jgi:hypothetical protein
MPSARVSADLIKVLDDKFSAHEHRSAKAISDLKTEVVSLIREQEKKHDERHAQTLGVLSAHGSRLDVHELRIDRVEEGEKAIVAKRDASDAEWRKWALGLLAAMLVSAVSSLLTLIRH